ncbi:hypothetical protein PF001_g32849, partial [Phytophthora fragariae]
CVFPHLENANTSDADAAADDYRALREKLLETSINLVESLVRVLGSAGDVVDVLQQALMTPECVVGDVNGP